MGAALEGFAQVKTIVVVLSSTSFMDQSALCYQIRASYPGAAVFFLNTSGTPFGPAVAGNVDLVIDFTSPQDRQSASLARKLKKRTRFLVGRKAGDFRIKAYTRLVEESDRSDWLDQQIETQRQVLLAAGVRLSTQGPALRDLSHQLPLELPLMQQTVGVHAKPPSDH
jgi:hypothetical protein